MNRNIIIISAVAAIIGAYVLFVSPLQDKRVPLREKLGVNYTTLLKYQKFMNASKGAGERLDAAQTRLRQLEQYISKKTNTSIGFAELQDRAQGIAEKAGLSIKSVKPMPTVQQEHYTSLPLYMDFTGDIVQLSAFLRAIDKGRVFISLDRLSIKTGNKGQLRIKMQVSGLMPR